MTFARSKVRLLRVHLNIEGKQIRMNISSCEHQSPNLAPAGRDLAHHSVRSTMDHYTCFREVCIK